MDGGSTEATTPEVTRRLGHFEVTVPTGYGPRLLGLRHDRSPDILLRMEPEAGITTEGVGTFHFRGGHRLWAAPEVPWVTYVPDDDPCEVTFRDGVIRVAGSVDAAGFAKELAVSVGGEELIVDHTLRWTGPGAVRAAAWSITQLPRGGTAVLPVVGINNGTALQADRSLVIWPYTDLSDPRLSFRPAAVVLDSAAGPKLKFGSGPAPGRVGYLREGWLFLKSVTPANAGDYADRGAVAQVFCNEEFCELESLGPLVELEAGSEVRHRERWSVGECPDVESAVKRVMGAGTA